MTLLNPKRRHIVPGQHTADPPNLHALAASGPDLARRNRKPSSLVHLGAMNEERRRLIQLAGTGTAIALLGGYYYVSDDLTREARAQTRSDGRPRLPPDQRVLKVWKPMGGEPGDPSLEHLELRVYGEVESPYTLRYADFLAMPQSTFPVDVHCVTGWTVLDTKLSG